MPFVADPVAHSLRDVGRRPAGTVVSVVVGPFGSGDRRRVPLGEPPLGTENDADHGLVRCLASHSLGSNDGRND